MIEKAHKFILKFVEDEYKVNRSAFDRNVSRTDHGNFVDKFLNTYYTPFYADILYGNMASMSLEHLSDEVVEKTYNSRIIRTPYLIRHYTNGRYGKGIQIKKAPERDLY